MHGMLRRIPLISSNRVNSYLDFIDSKLSICENLEYAPMLLELAILKSKITEQFDRKNGFLTVDMKMQYRLDFATMVSIMVPYVLSFLTDGGYGSDVIGCEDGHGDGISVGGGDDGIIVIGIDGDNSDENENEDKDEDNTDDDDNEEIEEGGGGGDCDGDDDGDGYYEDNSRRRRRLR
jgi:hypothetical protein